MGRLAVAIENCNAQLAAATSASCVRDLKLDDGTVQFSVLADSWVTISVVYSDADSYPSTSALLWSDTERHNEALMQLCDTSFQDRAPLHLVVKKVCQLFGRTVELEQLDSTGAGPSRSMEPEVDSCVSDSNADMDSDVEDSGGDEEDEEREMLLARRARVSKWEKFESEVEASETLATKRVASTQGSIRLHFFQPKEAFQMLSRELQDVIENHSQNMFVDCVGNDVYTWSLELASFDPNSRVHKDVNELQRKFQYSTVQLRINFMRGLHPFFPCKVEVLRPYFKHRLIWAVASHPMFKLSNWDPWRPVVELISEVKIFLESVGEVDLDHPGNDISTYPDSAYSQLEQQLARLEALCNLAPLCIKDVEHIYRARDGFQRDQARLDALSQSTKRMKSDKGTGSWAKGTGYGSGRIQRTPGQELQVWDAKAAEAAQRACDQAVQEVVEHLTRTVHQELGSSPESCGLVEPGASSLACGPSSSSQQQQHMQLDQVMTEAPSSSSPSPAAAAAPGTSGGGSAAGGGGRGGGACGCPAVGREQCLALLADSALVPFLVKELRPVSFTELCGRSEYYLCVLHMVLALCQPATCHLLQLTVSSTRTGDGETGGDSRPCTVASVMASLQSAAVRFSQVVKPLSSMGGGAASSGAATRTQPAAPTPTHPTSASMPPPAAVPQHQSASPLDAAMGLATSAPPPPTTTATPTSSTLDGLPAYPTNATGGGAGTISKPPDAPNRTVPSLASTPPPPPGAVSLPALPCQPPSLVPMPAHPHPTHLGAHTTTKPTTPSSMSAVR